jgi:butyryl-CoA dehydrogenase
MKYIHLKECLQTLADHAQAADNDLIWPTPSWEALVRAGVLKWSIDQADGGAALDPIALLDGYELLASACLTTCFILSQRASAIRHLKNMPNEELRHTLLSGLASGKSFATVGLSQLTTSRQHQRPALTANEVGDKYILNGNIPWVTGAAVAHHIVLGAVTDRNLQILAALPAGLPGVQVEAPLDLMALRGSLTAEVRLENVELDQKWLLAGPAERVLAAGKGGAGGLETSCLALGLADAAIDYVIAEAEARPDLQDSATNLDHDRLSMREELHRLAAEEGSSESAAALRTIANSLVLRATQVALTASKGTGFLRSHPAQRWARQALFFLVWSCPRPTTEATLAQLAPAIRQDCLL